VDRIRDLDVAHIRARGLPYHIAWEYGYVFDAAGLNLLEWRGHLWLNTTDTQLLEFAARLLPSQKTGLLAAGLTTEQEIDDLTAEVNRAATRPLRRSATFIIVDAIGEVPKSPRNEWTDRPHRRSNLRPAQAHRRERLPRGHVHDVDSNSNEQNRST
jgi:hypothetical protein